MPLLKTSSVKIFDIWIFSGFGQEQNYLCLTPKKSVKNDVTWNLV